MSFDYGKITYNIAGINNKEKDSIRTNFRGNYKLFSRVISQTESVPQGGIFYLEGGDEVFVVLGRHNHNTCTASLDEDSKDRNYFGGARMSLQTRPNRL